MGCGGGDVCGWTFGSAKTPEVGSWRQSLGEDDAGYVGWLVEAAPSARRARGLGVRQT